MGLLEFPTWFQQTSITSSVLMCLHEAGASPPSLRAPRGVRPAARRPHAAQDGYECGPTQIVNFIKTL